ncbi:MAG TPA: substrate-binding domain-containing protein, partial [Microbacterium sp.]|nr:substrate-binding domain-containing protein [Microbacterium sp.]
FMAAVRAADGPTAVFAANDQMALGLISGLSDAGVAVPGDVSIVGVDDNPDAAFYRPPLTTVRLDVAGEAARCIAQVLGESQPAASVDIASPELIVRKSVRRV